MNPLRFSVLSAVLAVAAVLSMLPAQRAMGASSILVDSPADTNTADGVLTLREAILLGVAGTTAGGLGRAMDAGETDNVTGGTPGAGLPDVITFSPGVFNGTQTILLTAALPQVSTGSDVIDGSGATVFIDGPVEDSAVNCLTISSSNNTVRNLSFTDCARGIVIQSAFGDNNIVFANVFFDNGNGMGVNGAAIEIGSAGDGNAILGNMIGVLANGGIPPDGGNANGITVFSNNNTIGGTSAALRNVVSNNVSGIVLNTGVTGTDIYGNYIGTNPTGLLDMGNTGSGISINNATGNTVGGTAAGQGNIISGNASTNIVITGTSSNNEVVGNRIGPDANGSNSLVSGDGVRVSSGATTNTIGPGNVISDNSIGVWLSSASNVVKGNMIGTDASGTSALSNSNDGVFLSDGANGNSIGGTIAGDGNVIAFNGSDGVEVNGAATGNPIRGNSIHDNGIQEILLINGGNGGQAAPTIQYATANGVAGTACANCIVDVFSDGGPDAEFYEGSATANGSGLFTLFTSIAGPNVTTTNTHTSNNTSALSGAVALSPDADGDGVANAFDNCPNTANQNQADSDADGDGDACDNCPAQPNSAQDDQDSDGVGDVCDNCGNTDNGPAEALILGVGNQTDSDGDGLPGTSPPAGAMYGGDACDVDDDNDGKPDATDGCRTSPEDYDSFEDGDGCADADNDGDGICDAGVTSVSCSGSDVGRYLWANPLPAPVDCRNVDEDYDSFHDGDGCPEPDNDYDNFPDGTDDCPATDGTVGNDGVADTGDEPVLYLTPYQSREDFDGVIDNDGCHDSPGDDYDLDGFSDEAEALHIGTSPVNQCGFGGWPADLVGGQLSENRVTIQDLGSFLIPNRFNTSPGDLLFDERWDLLPGPPLPTSDWIGLQDIGALLAGSTSTPPMLQGAAIFNGPACPGG
jgi:hypothetical protein